MTLVPLVGCLDDEAIDAVCSLLRRRPRQRVPVGAADAPPPQTGSSSSAYADQERQVPSSQQPVGEYGTVPSTSATPRTSSTAAPMPQHGAEKGSSTGRWRLMIVLVVAAFILYESRHPVAELLKPSPWLQTYSDLYYVNAYGVFGERLSALALWRWCG